MPKAFPLELRRDVAAVARAGEAPLTQIAKDFGISEACLHRWLKLADVEDGVRPGVTGAEATEVRELRNVRALVAAVPVGLERRSGLLEECVAAGHRKRR